MDLQRYVAAIFRGRYDQAETPAPSHDLDHLEAMAAAAHAAARRPEWHSSPRVMAHELGYKTIPRAPPGLCGEGTRPGLIGYEWDADPRVRGLRVGHGLAHRVLDRASGDSNDADAWIVTGGILVPRWVVRCHDPASIAARAHAPAWFVELRISFVILTDAILTDSA